MSCLIRSMFQETLLCRFSNLITDCQWAWNFCSNHSLIVVFPSTCRSRENPPVLWGRPFGKEKARNTIRPSNALPSKKGSFEVTRKIGERWPGKKGVRVIFGGLGGVFEVVVHERLLWCITTRVLLKNDTATKLISPIGIPNHIKMSNHSFSQFETRLTRPSEWSFSQFETAYLARNGSCGSLPNSGSDPLNCISYSTQCRWVRTEHWGTAPNLAIRSLNVLPQFYSNRDERSTSDNATPCRNHDWQAKHPNITLAQHHSCSSFQILWPFAQCTKGNEGGETLTRSTVIVFLFCQKHSEQKCAEVLI